MSARLFPLALALLASCAAPAPAAREPVCPPAPTSPPAPASPRSHSQTPAPLPERDLTFAAVLARLAGRCEAAPVWVSPDGAKVAFCQNDPGRLLVPALELLVYDSEHDRFDERLHIASPLDLERIEPWLGFTPLQPFEMADDPTHPGRGTLVIPPRQASGDGLTVRYRDPTLTVLGPDGRVLEQRAFPSWKADAWASGCHVPGGLSGVLSRVSGSRASGVFVITLQSTNAIEGCGAYTHVTRLSLMGSGRSPTTSR